MNITILREGLRIFITDLRRKIEGNRIFFGNDEQICKLIIDSGFNGRYYQVSYGHFRQFYARDFGWTIESLMHLGKKKEVQKTLEYALERYEKHGRIAVTITPGGAPYDFPNISVDSVAYLFRSLRIAGAKALVKKHKRFLEKEAKRMAGYLTHEGLLDPRINFSGMRDYAIRKSSCYDNTFMAVLSDELDRLGLDNPLKKFDLKKNLVKNFWNGHYFNDDLENTAFASDANIYPFWLGLLDDKKMLRSVIDEVEKRGLDKPFPLKYSSDNKGKMIFLEVFVKDWEQDCIWAHMGLPYIEVLSKVDKKKARQHLESYRRMIEKNKNFLEVYHPDGRQYRSLFYLADEGMVWAANYLRLKKQLI